MIPFSSPHAQYLSHQFAIDAAIKRVLDSGRYILGNEVESFELAFADYLGVAEGVGVATGTDAITLALKAHDIGPGDEVITTSHTAVATVTAIVATGATPVLVDIDADRLTLDPTQLEAAISPHTRALVVVHLYGQPADLDPILAVARHHAIAVIEDCAQAHGAIYKGKRVGSFGDAATFSFYPTKNLGAIGDGGLIATRSTTIAARLRKLREYGWEGRYVSTEHGMNSRLDPLQAAILGVKLPHLDADNAHRAALAASYDRYLTGQNLLLPQRFADSSPVFHLYVVRHPERKRLQDKLAEHGVTTLIHYPVPVHLQPGYCAHVRTNGALPNTTVAASQVLSLPLYPELPEADVHQVASILIDILSHS